MTVPSQLSGHHVCAGKHGLFPRVFTGAHLSASEHNVTEVLCHLVVNCMGHFGLNYCRFSNPVRQIRRLIYMFKDLPVVRSVVAQQVFQDIRGQVMGTLFCHLALELAKTFKVSTSHPSRSFGGCFTLLA